MNHPGRRLLVIPSWYPPDGGQFFQDHAEALAARGMQVDVLVNRVVGITKIRCAHRYTFRRFSVSARNGTRVIRSFFLKGPRMELWNMRRWSRSTSRLFRKYGSRFGSPELLVAHSAIWAGYAAALISEETGIPYLLVEHRSRFTLGKEAAGDYLKPSYEAYLRQAYGAARRIVMVSDALSDGILRYSEQPEKLLTIPNMVDTGFFRPASDRERRGLYILSVGRLDPEKGMDLLIGAFSRLVQQYPQATLGIIGAGKEMQYLRALARDRGVAGSVVFHGKLDARGVLEQLQHASMFALASRFEAFGVVYLEAMAAGLPVLATRAGGPQSFIPGFAGEVVETEDEDALLEGMSKMAGNLDRYNREKIRTHVQDHFSREAVAIRYEDLINELLHD